VSKQLESQVWLSDLDGDLKPLAAVLADIANDSGNRIYPSVAYMAWKLSRSERCVQDRLSKLKEIGVVSVVKNASGGRGIFTHYRLHADKLPTRPPWSKDDEDCEKGEESAPFQNDKRVQPATERVNSATQKGADSAPKTLGYPSDNPSVESGVEELNLGNPSFTSWAEQLFVKSGARWEDPKWPDSFDRLEQEAARRSLCAYVREHGKRSKLMEWYGVYKTDGAAWKPRVHKNGNGRRPVLDDDHIDPLGNDFLSTAHAIAVHVDKTVQAGVTMAMWKKQQAEAGGK
jgi:hypothetical protein